MRVILFQDRFVELIRNGAKPHTIRKSARCKPGDRLSLRRWTGKPYRSKQEIILEAVCVSIRPISMGHGIDAKGISIDSEECHAGRRQILAKQDGFKNDREMLMWFAGMQGLPFQEVLTEWRADDMDKPPNFS